MGFFSALAAVVSIGTSLYGMSQANKADKASQAADRERRAAAKVQTQINEKKFYKDRIYRIAEARKTRAAVKAQQITQNMGGSSDGQIGNIQSQASSNFAFQSTIFGLGQQISGLQYNASIFDSKANAALAKGERAKAYADISSTIFENA